MKTIINLYIFILVFLLLPKTAFASQDILITCSSEGECLPQDNNPMFSENNIFPGFSVSKKIDIDNKKIEPCRLSVKTMTDMPDYLSEKLLIGFIQNGLVSYAGNLRETRLGVEIGDIPPQSNKSYLITLTLDKNSGNDIANSSFTFDQIFNFNCNVNILPTPTPSTNHPIIISEFMPSPVDNNEWIEIFNQSDSEVTISGWKIDDQLNGGRMPKNINTASIPAKTLHVMELGSSFLDNNGDSVVLINDKNQIIDQYDYSASSNTLSWTKQPNSTWCLSNQSKGFPNYPCFNQTGSEDNSLISQTQTTTSCNDTPPSGVPVITKSVPIKNGVTLYWSPPAGPLNYYLIAYGLQSGNYKYGNPNIGSKATTSYTVNSLSSDRTYYFRVRAGNGCAPGSFSDEVAVRPLGDILTTNTLPSGFLENVLGIAKTDVDNGSKAVLGQNTDTTKTVDHRPKTDMDTKYILILTTSILLFFVIKRLKRKFE